MRRDIYFEHPFDGKYILDGERLIICQSNTSAETLRETYAEAEINPIGDWTGSINVDSGATNRKLGSDMADSVTGGGLHGKDLSKADVSVNIYAFLKAQETGEDEELLKLEIESLQAEDFDTGQGFLRVQEILEERSGKEEHKRTVSMSNKSKSLLGGNLFCAHCGCRMVGSRRTEKTPHKDGTFHIREYGIYVCYHSSRKLNGCDGQTTYKADRVDQCVLDTVREIFANIAGCPEEEKMKMALKRSVELTRGEIKTLSEQIAKDEKQLEMLQLEIANALSGNSIYSPEDLSSAISGIRDRIASEKNRFAKLQNEKEERALLSEGILPAYRRFRTWALEFDEASFTHKKMIINELFSKITLGRDYQVHCEINFTYQQFCTELATLEEKVKAVG